MKKIRCTLIGRGSIGTVYCAALAKCAEVEFSIAADSARIRRYTTQAEPLKLNGEVIIPARYFTPAQGDPVQDLIIITTKWGGFLEALDLIEPLVGEDTLILPLLNGLLPWEVAAQRYGAQRVKRGYYIGSTATMTPDEGVQLKGNYNTVMERCRGVEKIFDMAGVCYTIEEDIEAARWQKFIINLGMNHTSALRGGVSYGEIRNSPELLAHCIATMERAAAVAHAMGVNGAEQMPQKALDLLAVLQSEDYSSMAQDVRAGRETERAILLDDLERREREL